MGDQLSLVFACVTKKPRKNRHNNRHVFLFVLLCCGCFFLFCVHAEKKRYLAPKTTFLRDFNVLLAISNEEEGGFFADQVWLGNRRDCVLLCCRYISMDVINSPEQRRRIKNTNPQHCQRQTVKIGRKHKQRTDSDAVSCKPWNGCPRGKTVAPQRESGVRCRSAGVGFYGGINVFLATQPTTDPRFTLVYTTAYIHTYISYAGRAGTNVMCGLV